MVSSSVSTLLFVFTWPIVSIGAPPAKAQATPAFAALPVLVARIKPSVVSVLVYNNEEAVSQGTGWFLSPTEIVTNRHVLAPGTRAEIQLASGETVPVLSVLAETTEQDLVILAVELRGTPPRPIPLASTEPSVGSRVFTIGNPLGLELTVSEGIVSAVRELPLYGTILQTTAAVSPGSSGGPLLDMHGRVVGVVVSQITEGQALNFAIAADAIRSLQKTKARTPSKWLASGQNPTGEAHRTLGVAAYLQGDYEEALRQFRKAVEEGPSDSSSHSSLGLAYGALERWREAINPLKQAIRIKPDYANAHYFLGAAYGKLGRWQQAIDTYKQAIRIKPSFFEAQNNLGGAYGALERWQEAIDAHKQTIRIKPDDAKAHYDLGVAYGALERWQPAIDAHKQAIRIKPDYADAHFLLGVVYVLVGNKGAAFDVYKVLKQLDTELANKLFADIYP